MPARCNTRWLWLLAGSWMSFEAAALTTLASTSPTVFEGNLDVRVNARERLPELLPLRDRDAAAVKQQILRGSVIDPAVRALAERVPGLQLRRSSATGAIDALLAESGALSKAAPALSSEQIVRSFLADNHDLYGLSAADCASLVVIGDSPGGRSGLRMLRMEQRLHGLPIFETETRFLIDPQGRLWRALGAPVPTSTLAATKSRPADLITPALALESLFAWQGLHLDAAQVVEKRSSGDLIELQAPSPVSGPASARLVWFPLAPGVLIPAWSLTVFSSGTSDWSALIDARNGQLLWRRNLRDYASTQQARFGVYVQADGATPADSPAPKSPNTAVPGAGSQFPAIARTPVNMLTTQNPLASPNGWIDDCPSASNGCDSTRGNNVEACLDRDATENVCDVGVLDADGRAVGNPDAAARNRDFLGTVVRDFEYTPPPLVANPDAGDNPLNPDSQRGALVQAYYIINWYHDRLYALGFDEASGNFQQLNLHGQGGLDGDRIAADVQNSGANGANFSTPADGAGPGRMQLYLHTGPAPDRDSALDAGIIVHELSHGLSHRLIGNSNGLLWDVARSMGEGWSDFYALALLNTSASDDPHGQYPFAPWVTYKLSGMTDNYVYGYRRFPYSTDHLINPLTFEDIDAVTRDDSGGIVPSPLNLSAVGALEVHNAGSIWASALWEVRARIIGIGSVQAGNEIMLQLVTDALKLTPANPSFIDGRDALIAADCATNGCAHEREIWEGFADRGLGYRAIAPQTSMGRFALSHIGIGVSFELPHLDVIDVATAVMIDDTAFGNGDGRLDPGETATVAITLSNPLHAADLTATGVSATLSSASPGVTVLDAQASYADIPAQATVSSGAGAFQIRLSDQASCGSRLAFDLQTSSSLGSRLAHFDLRVGAPAGVGPAQTFSSAPGLIIPANSPDGVFANMDIGTDLDIADLNFRIDSLSHPVTGHLSVMLRAPNGYGTDLIWRRGALMVPNQGGGADFLGVEIDDDLALTAANDLNQSLSTQAPFTGSWLPAYNSPFWDSYRPTPPSPAPELFRDPVAQLARLDGLSSQGRWSINIANGSPTLPGTLHGWSLIVQPRAYSCSVFVPNEPIFSNGFE
jgi:subtilisin-like proprotein convertase family protein